LLPLNTVDSVMSSIHPRLINDLEKGVQSPLSILSLMNAQSDGASRSNLFPPLFNQQFHQIYNNLLQQQLLQQMAAQNGSSIRDGSSPSHSDADIDSPTTDDRKRVRVDEDGSASCPLCEERLQDENEWREHVEMERHRLRNIINDIKNPKTGSETPSKEPRRSGELERIRSNLNRRRALKTCDDKKSPSSTLPLLNSIPTPSNESPLTCCTCQRSIEYGIVCSPLEGARCQECFDVVRAL
ncbi:hypothetical protein PFISCL1PPCAC_6311, partial [Pristionchus fissidentatus]